MIEKVEMLENGKPVAADQHPAPAGPGYDNNEFRLNISTVDPSAKYSLRAWVHSLGEKDSTGYVTVSPPKGCFGGYAGVAISSGGAYWRDDNRRCGYHVASGANGRTR
jgi:hypothetical protein